LFADWKLVSRTAEYRWRAISVTLTILVIIALARNELAVNASLEASNQRLVKWYEAAKSQKSAQSGLSLTIFTDYECPNCRVQVPVFISSANAASNHAIRITTKDFPLDRSCNDDIPKGAESPHPSACLAAASARWVYMRDPSEAENFRVWLYANQGSITRDTINKKLETLNLLNGFSDSYERIMTAVKADIEEGTQYGVNSTPSLILNGVKLPNLSNLGLEVLIRHELGRIDNPGAQSRK
jgi:hypothetical protein